MNTEHTNQSRQAANAAFEQWWQRHGLTDPMDDEDRQYATASSWARRGYLAATQAQQDEATLCASCARANVDCPIYPQQTASCVEHRPAAQQQAERVLPAVKESLTADRQAAFRVGNLVTYNQDEYPGLGTWYVQLWDGEAVAARVYGNDREELQRRIDALNTARPPAVAVAAPEGWLPDGDGQIPTEVSAAGVKVLRDLLGADVVGFYEIDQAFRAMLAAAQKGGA